MMVWVMMLLFVLTPTRHGNYLVPGHRTGSNDAESNDTSNEKHHKYFFLTVHTTDREWASCRRYIICCWGDNRNLLSTSYLRRGGGRRGSAVSVLENV